MVLRLLGVLALTVFIELGWGYLLFHANNVAFAAVSFALILGAIIIQMITFSLIINELVYFIFFGC